MPRIIDVDTSAPAYTTRHAQFKAIVQFWNPLIAEALKMNQEQLDAWRASDPFLNDILRWHEAIRDRDEKEFVS
jgi:hypothetical protein